jgi:uncharacterized protein (DUF885 family)
VTTSEHRRNPHDDVFVRRICALRPELEAVLGLFDHPGALPDPDPDARAGVRAANTAWRHELERQAGESKERLLDARVFSASLELQHFVDDEIATWCHDPDDVGPISEALLLQLRGPVPASPEVRFDALARRLTALPGWLARVRSASMATDAFAPSIELAIRARDVLDGMPELLRAIAVDAAAVGGEGDHERAPLAGSLLQDLDRAVDDASGALDEHRDWLTSLRAEPHPPMGVERLDEFLRLRGLDLSADEVLELGRSVAEEMRVELGRIVRRHFKEQARDRDVEGALAAARATVPDSLVEALAWTNDLVSLAREFVADSGVVPLPDVDTADAPLSVHAMPATLAPAGQAAIYVPPPPYAPRHEGMLFLREPPGPQQQALKELSVADLETLVAALGFPGRHAQAVWQHRATTLARRGALAGVGAGGGSSSTWGLDMVHGWGLVSAELMRELAFRPSPATRLLTVQQTLVAALVAVVDVRLALGRVTPEAATAFLVRRATLRLPVARAVVRTLLKAPTTGLSALVGKVRIEQLRREARKRWRAGYSDRRFHALLLVNGPVPLAYLFERLDEPPGYVTDVVTASSGL